MTSKRGLLRQQRLWAQSMHIEPDARGYLETIESNLWRPLSPATLAAFEQGGGAELEERGTRPAKMRALHSSAALVVNVFDYWASGNPASLLQGLGIESPLKSLAFEARFPTELAGHPPNLDVALELVSGTVVGIESKFTEWLMPKRRNKPAFKAKYFDDGALLWTKTGLLECQTLAAELMNGTESFHLLDAAQLLKHALGLATHHPGRFSLYYLFYDVPGPASEAHQHDIARFAHRVGAELGFRVMTYQELYRALSACKDVDGEYLGYLGARYFPAPS